MMVISKRRAAGTFLIMKFGLQLRLPVGPVLHPLLAGLPKLHFPHACAETRCGGNVYSPQTNFIVTRVTW